MGSKRRLGSALAVCLLLGTVVVAAVGPAKKAAAASNPIVVENQQTTGVSNGWMLTQFARDDTVQQIKGYASATSVLQGGSLSFFVTVNPAQTFAIDVYRVGWYGGVGGRLRLHAGPINGVQQPACPADPTTGMVACNWSAGYTLNPIPADWTSGVYLAVLTNAAGWQNYVIFVVRDDRPAAYLYQQSVTTYEAYNNYPNDPAPGAGSPTTGKSLYQFNSSNGVRAYKVSFDRPYSYHPDGSGQFLSFGEIDLVRWLEKNGYDVTYSTDVDTHAGGAALLNHKALLSPVHDEYWSKEMFDAAQAARDSGVNLGFFGADAVYWQIRFEPSASGVANRVVVCYKDASLDPVQGPTTTVMFRSAPVNRPEQTLMGVQFTSQVNFGSNVPYVVTNSSNWVYAGTGFKNGDTVPNLVGYEMDRLMSPVYPTATSLSQTLLSHSPYTTPGPPAGPDYQTTSIYQAPSGAWVFAAATLSWAQGLDNEDSVIYFSSFNAVNAGIQQMTANLLNAFLVGAPVVHHLQVTSPAATNSGTPVTVTVTAANFQGNPVTQYAGTVHFTSTDTHAVLPADYTFGAADAGTHQFSVTLKSPGSQTLTATDTSAGSIAGSATVSVSPGANQLSVTGLSNATAGTSQTTTVSVKDASGNPATGYTGTVHLASTDAQAVLAADYTFTAADAGTHQFAVTLKTAGGQTLTVTDTITASITGSQTVTISPGPLNRLALSPSTATVTAGAGQTYAAGGFDQYGNALGDVTAGSTFTVTPDGSCVGAVCTATVAGAHTVTAINGTVTATAALTVVPGPASVLKLTGLAPATAGTAQTVKVTLYDQYGNVATGFAGTVHFSSSDKQAALPADYTFTNADAGTHQFTVTLKTSGSQTVTVGSGPMSSAMTVAIKAGAATTLTLTGPTSATTGMPITVTVTLKDAYGNVADGYLGTVNFSSSDVAAVLPGPYAFTAADAGTKTFQVTLVTPTLLSPTTVTATDTSSSNLSSSISVSVL